MVVLENRTTMVEYTWQRKKASARLSLWNARNARSGTTRQKKIVVMIPAGWS
jgi:hypothetical protein